MAKQKGGKKGSIVEGAGRRAERKQESKAGRERRAAGRF